MATPLRLLTYTRWPMVKPHNASRGALSGESHVFDASLAQLENDGLPTLKDDVDGTDPKVGGAMMDPHLKDM